MRPKVRIESDGTTLGTQITVGDQPLIAIAAKWEIDADSQEAKVTLRLYAYHAAPLVVSGVLESIRLVCPRCNSAWETEIKP